MKRLKRRISNPMTIIAIFAALSETSAAVSLPFLDNDERKIYVWFLISFPFYLLFLFFLTLNFNYRSLYAPSDFDKDKSFIKAIDNAERPATPGFSSRVKRFRHWFWSAQGPPPPIHLHIGIREQHSVYLPGRLKGLSIVDTRGMDTQAGYTTLMEKIRKLQSHPIKVIVFLACRESEKLLKEGALKHSKLKRKGTRETFCIVYNLSSQGVTVLDQTFDE
ncbi:hypothetical protein [Pseudomonas sp. B21-053]|uniref:hypothetical protein n=1 Tax=Pseudomonas sp. B21-053 TaxID=2895493 RepID=UPI002231DB65|nr:hypothetical protein [Pseudomonas sp. B21-053]UZE10801.1 hypothetical protein LOY68_25425 [Pseudomonas sp. B21-053]